jgi:hypothetical protein
MGSGAISDHFAKQRVSDPIGATSDRNVRSNTVLQ